MREVKVGNVTLGGQERMNILQVIANNWVSPGPFVKEFEAKFAAYHDCQYGIMVNSGTDALRLSLLAMKEKYGWKDGAEVIVPALTFVATINVVLQCNLTPVFVDVSPADLNIDVRLLAKAFTFKTVAVIPVHLFGNPCEMDFIDTFARINNLKVLEDSCECMGVSFRHRSVGAWGNAAAFSTYACHMIQTGVGGIVTTNDETLAELVRSYMNHGRRSEYLKDRFIFERVGYSARPDEFQAAIGLAQLSKLSQWIEKRRRNAVYLSERLADDTFWKLSTENPNQEKSWMMYPLVLNRSSIDRDKLTEFLAENGVETRPLFPLLTQPVLKGKANPHDYPVALKASKQGFYVGCHQDLDEQDMACVGARLLEGVNMFSGKVAA